MKTRSDVDQAARARAPLPAVALHKERVDVLFGALAARCSAVLRFAVRHLSIADMHAPAAPPSTPNTDRVLGSVGSFVGFARCPWCGLLSCYELVLRKLWRLSLYSRRSNANPPIVLRTVKDVIWRTT